MIEVERNEELMIKLWYKRIKRIFKRELHSKNFYDTCSIERLEQEIEDTKEFLKKQELDKNYDNHYQISKDEINDTYKFLEYIEDKLKERKNERN